MAVLAAILVLGILVGSFALGWQTAEWVRERQQGLCDCDAVFCPTHGDA